MELFILKYFGLSGLDSNLRNCGVSTQSSTVTSIDQTPRIGLRKLLEGKKRVGDKEKYEHTYTCGSDAHVQGRYRRWLSVKNQW